MKPILLLLISLIFICLLQPTNLFAEQVSGDQEEMTELQVTLKEYKDEGYKWMGPVQYLGKTIGKIKLYRNNPVSYRVLDTIDETGEQCSVKKYDFVYVLSKQGHVVLICLDREGRDNA